MDIDLQIKRMLPYTWDAFLGSFGSLREIQRKTIPLVLNRENLVISSPAATGKTEAIITPIVELWMQEQSEGLYGIYISPTRALVNDLYKRLLPPFEALNIPIGRRTGDKHSFNLKTPEPFLLTTPESLDSLIARHTKVFESVRVVVLDEIHLLHHSYRGDQTRVLLNRLQLLNPKINNFYALSATIGDPLQIGKAYLPANFKTVTVPGTLEIEYQLRERKYVRETLADEFRNREIRKVLVFTNSRAEAENYVKLFKFQPFKNRVWVHHGSLSKREREEVEELMNSPGFGICIATSTLEFGIDIGDVDAVVLFEPPPDVSSLLQRVGRGCRRKDNYMLAYGVYANNFERLMFDTMFEDAKIGNFLPRAKVFDPSVVCQQVFSYLYQKRRVGTSMKAIKRILEGIVEESAIEKIIEALVGQEVIEVGKSNLYYLTHKLGELIEFGKIHSNIHNKTDVEVIDARTDKKIGVVQKPLASFRLGGTKWTATKVDEDKLFVNPASHSEIMGNVFCGKGIFWWDFRQGERLKNKLFNNTSSLPYFIENGKTYLFHFTGPVYGILWQRVLNEKGIEIEDVRDFLFLVNKQVEVGKLIFTYDEILAEANKFASQIKRFLDFGAFFYLLSPEMKKEAIISALELQEFTTHIQHCQFELISDELGQKIIKKLTNGKFCF